jgi:hypothetical protein
LANLVTLTAATRRRLRSSGKKFRLRAQNFFSDSRISKPVRNFSIFWASSNLPGGQMVEMVSGKW